MASFINKIVVTNEVELRSALLAAANTAYTCISIESGSQPMLLSSPLVLPTKLATNNSAFGNKLIIEGNGVSLVENYNSVIPPPGNEFLLGRTYGERATQPYAVVIKDINFVQKSTSYPSLQLVYHNNSIVDNCSFINGVTGIIAAYCTNLNITNSQFNSMTGYAIDVNYGSGIINNANKDSYACKQVTISKCYFNPNSNSLASINLLATQNPVVTNCTFGSAPNYHIWFRSLGGTSIGYQNMINNFTGNNLTFLSAATAPVGVVGVDPAALYLSLAEGYAELNGLMYLDTSGVLIKGESTKGNPTIYVNGFPKWNSGVQFQTVNGVTSGCAPVSGGSVIWDFKNLDIDRASEIFDSTNWVNGAIPFYRYAEFYKIPDGKKILTNYLSVNGKVIS